MNIHPASLGCDCCTGREHVTPESTKNRPGLPALRFRVGTHSTFKETMLAALSEWRPLDGLTTRDDDDPTIGLIDAWATVLDVLTFYQERIANEGYLSTAIESRSVRELAAAVGYVPAPAVAAETYLAFEMETAPTAPSKLTLEGGAKVQSLPGPGELPQVFETIEDIVARPEWNSIAVRQTVVSAPASGVREVYLAGRATRVAVGDGVVFVGRHRETNSGSEQWDFRRVTDVETLADRGVTRIAWDVALGDGGTSPSEDVKVFVFRSQASVFGYNAPDLRLLPDSVKKSFGLKKKTKKWPLELTGGDPGTVDLDAVYDDVTPDSWAVLASSEAVELYEVTAVSEQSRTDYTLVGKVSRLTLSGDDVASRFGGAVRETAVFVQSDRLQFGAVPITAPVEGTTLALDDEIPELDDERVVIVAGRRAVLEVAEAVYDVAFVPDSGASSVALVPGDRLVVQAASSSTATKTTWEVAMPDGTLGTVTVASGKLRPVAAGEDVETVAERVELDGASTVVDGVTTIVLNVALENAYDRASCHVKANVAYATHGESKQEVLGSGDAAVGWQRFDLAHKPLTYVPSKATTGSATTLTIRVNDQAWQGVSSLYLQDRRARVYAVGQADDGAVRATFGDGAEGARLPTGIENVTAEYRVGAGLDGMVAEGQLSLLLSRPLGLKGVTNPLAAEGGADGETRDEARQNAPLTVLTFERIVSVTDYEDFALGFPGVAKARGAMLWDGSERIVHVTIAGTDGAAVGQGTTVHTNLVAAMRSAGGAQQRFKVDTYESVRFDVTAGLFIDDDYDTDDVGEKALAALVAAYSFSKRSLAAAVPLAEVAAVLQRVDGVVGVDIDVLAPAGGSGAVNLVALAARPTPAGIEPAQLLTTTTAGITLVTRP